MVSLSGLSYYCQTFTFNVGSPIFQSKLQWLPIQIKEKLPSEKVGAGGGVCQICPLPTVVSTPCQGVGPPLRALPLAGSECSLPSQAGLLGPLR